MQRARPMRAHNACRQERVRVGGPAGRHRRASSNRLREPTFQELSQLRCGSELRDGIVFLECRCEYIRETPDRSWPESFISRLEVPHRFEVALHTIHANLDAVDWRERIRGFGQHRSKHAKNNISKSDSGQSRCPASRLVIYNSAAGRLFAPWRDSHF